MKKFILIFSSLCMVLTAKSQPGFLDKSFGDTGLVLQPAGFYCPCMFDGSNSITVQNDKKILAAGNVASGLGIVSLGIVRYLPDGNIDYSYGDSGLATAPLEASVSSIGYTAEGNAIAMGVYFADIVLVRFTNKGKIDSSFGINGISIIDFGKFEYPLAMQLQADDKIVISGVTITDITNPDTKMFVARFNTNGQPDKTFGNNGITVSAAEVTDASTGLAIQSDNKILAGATLFTGGENNKFIIERYNPDGSIDNSFGNNGSVITDFSAHDDNLTALALQTDGKIIAAAQGNYEYAINGVGLFMRYNADGSVDKSFGVDGAVTVQFENMLPAFKSVFIDNNKIIGIGDARGVVNSGIPSQIALTRINSNGSLDSSFGIDGKQLTSIDGNITVAGGALQDHKILTWGYTIMNITGIPILARYNNETQKQIIISKIHRWLQHRNGIMWDNINGIKNYTVQRSGDGSHWSTVSSQQPIVNRQLSTVNYYNDPAPLSGTNYYRLQTTSVDGAVNYSNVIAVTDDNVSDISIYPNPVKDIIYIKGLDVNTKYKIQITNEAGNLVLSAQIKNTASYKFNVKNFYKGLYYISVSINQDIAITQKFLKE